MGSKKAKKDSKEKKTTRTSPRKQKAARDAEPEEGIQEQSQEPTEEPLPEGEAAGPEGDGDKTDKAGTVCTTEQDEQIAAFFEEHTFFYDMTNSEYKNKKKRENLLLELARSMFESGKLKISFQIIFPRQCFVEQCCSFSPSVQNVLRNIDHNDTWCKLVY